MRSLFVYIFSLLCASAPLSAQTNGVEQVSDLVTVGNDKFLRWYGHHGRSYFLQISDPNDHLKRWIWAPIIESGNEENISYEVDGTADKGFFRLKHTDQVLELGETLETADFDGDFINNWDEITSHSTDPLNPDTDEDGMDDFYEVWYYATDPNNPDSDGDGLRDGIEAFVYGTNPSAVDSDNDGLSDGVEINQHGTDPNDADTDNDGMSDGYEITHLFNPLIAADPAGDIDLDRMPNGWEYLNGLKVAVNDASADLDRDDLINLQEYINGTKANNFDTDGDLLSDGWEVRWHLNPLSAQGDDGASGEPEPQNDGLTNFQEQVYGTDPKSWDSDGDDVSDGVEVAQGSDPNDPSDGGNPPSQDEKMTLKIIVGDPSESHSERWAVKVKDLKTGNIILNHQSEEFGELSPESSSTFKMFRRDRPYEFHLVHIGTDPDKLEINPSFYPDYDWALELSIDDGQGNFIDVKDPKQRRHLVLDPWNPSEMRISDTVGLLVKRNQLSYPWEGDPDRTAQYESQIVPNRVVLLPVQTVVGEPGTPSEAPDDYLTAESTPAPSVEASVTLATLQGETLVVRLQGTVRDAVSRFASNAAELPQALNFYHQDELIHTIAINDTVGDGFAFNETVHIAGVKAMTYVIRAETTANISGTKGYDESAVSLTWEEDSSAFPTLTSPLSIAFPVAPGEGVVDQATLFFGNGMPQGGDTPLTESAADSWTFNGNLQIPATPAALTAPCNLKFFSPPNLSVTQADSIVVNLQYTAPGFAKSSHYGRWDETGVNTLVFRPSGWVFGNRLLKVSRISDLNGSAPSSFEPVTLRFPSLPDSYSEAGLQIVSGGVAYDLVKEGNAWYPEDPDAAGEVKLFLPSALAVPSRLSANGYDESEGELKFSVRIPDISDWDAPEILVVPGAAGAAAPPAMLGVPSPQLQSQGSPSLNNTNATTIPPWHPGQPLLKEHVIWAYRLLHADNTFALELLNGFLRGSHQIETGDVTGDDIDDLDLDLQRNNLSTDADNIWTIQIEEDNNPVFAANLLLEGLKQVTPYHEVFDHYVFENLGDDMDTFRAAMGAAVQETQRTAIAATELYLSGLGVVNEGLDWIIIVNDVSEGHYESLAAALPFVPAGLVKSGGRLIIRKSAGEVLDTLDTAGVAKLKEVAVNRTLATIGTVYGEEGYSMFLRKVLSSDSGPITPPTRRATLKDRMTAVMPRPGGIFGGFFYQAHHDLPWEMRIWFADHGIDVNDAAYGRWANKTDHKAWHRGAGGGEFNAWWLQVEAAEKTVMDDGGEALTKLEIIEKLEECRSKFFETD